MFDKLAITAHRLSLLSEQKGVTRKELAQAFGCDISLITRHLNGTRTVSSEFLVMYARYFHVTTDYLLGLTNEKSTNGNIRYISDLTGLNKSSIDTLRFFKKYNIGFIDMESPDKVLSTLNHFIESGSFCLLITHLHDYYSALKEKSAILNDYMELNGHHDSHYMPDGVEKLSEKMDVALMSAQEIVRKHAERTLQRSLRTSQHIQDKIYDDMYFFKGGVA